MALNCACFFCLTIPCYFLAISFVYPLIFSGCLTGADLKRFLAVDFLSPPYQFWILDCFVSASTDEPAGQGSQPPEKARSTRLGLGNLVLIVFFRPPYGRRMQPDIRCTREMLYTRSAGDLLPRPGMLVRSVIGGSFAVMTNGYEPPSPRV